MRYRMNNEKIRVITRHFVKKKLILNFFVDEYIISKDN